MKTPRIATIGLALAVTLAAPLALASDNASKRTPIRPVSKCLDLSRSIESYVIDDKTIIAASGPNYFRINLSAPCSHLGVGNLQLRTGNDSQRRMCGEIGDKVITRDGLHCQVQSLDILTRDQFKSMERAKRAK